MEKTAIEIIEEFARNSNRETEKAEHLYEYKALRRIPPTERWITVKDKGSAVFFGYDNSSMDVNNYARISGIAIPVNMGSANLSLKIQNKDIFDKLSFYKKTQKSSDNDLNRKFVFESNHEPSFTTLFADRKFKQYFIDTFSKIIGLHLEVNNHQINGIPNLKNQPILCLYKLEWILEAKLIEDLFKLAYAIYDRLLERRIISASSHMQCV